MHTLHYVAVKLDTGDDYEGNFDAMREDASAEVHSTLIGDERPYGDWYDWFVVGGGRFVAGDAYSNSADHIIIYGEDKDKFLEKMNEGLDWGLENAKRLHEEVSRTFDLDSAMARFEKSYNNNTPHDFSSSMGAWAMRRLVSIVEGYWNPDSHFIDITNGTPFPRYLLDDIEQNPDSAGNWALVPVDFHY